MKRLRLRPEVFGVALLLAILSPVWSLHWLSAVIVHELGHGVVGAAIVRRAWRLDVQLGAADAYLLPSDGPSVRWAVATSGVALSVVWALGIGAVGLDPSAAWAWVAYQAFIFPASDGGVLLRDGLVRRGTEPSRAFRGALAVSTGVAGIVLTALWGLGWMKAFAIGSGLVIAAVVVAETEWPALVHVEAYRAWSERRPTDVLRWAEKMRRGGPRLWAHVRELAVRAAIELGRDELVRSYGGLLPTDHTARLEAAEWLLRRDDAGGAQWAEQALDDFLRLPSRWDADHRERLRELLVRFALFEARQGRIESAAGLVERACGLGPVSFEWLEYAPGGAPLLAHSRVARLRT